MARKRHAKKHRRSRRRGHVGAVASDMTSIAGLLAGAIAGKLISSKLLPNVNPKYTALGQVAAGLVLPRFVKNNFVKSMGAGMIVNGGMSALSSFGVLAGIGADDTNVEFIGGSDEIQTIAGDDEIGYTEDMISGSADLETIAGIGEDEIGAFEDQMYS